MSLFNKFYDITHSDLFKHVSDSGSHKVFVANVSKISTWVGVMNGPRPG